MHEVRLPLVMADRQPVVNRVEALLLLEAVRTHPAQRRTALAVDERLMRGAEARARDLYYHPELGPEHVTSDGKTPNEAARETGYRLPDWYPAQGNQIETLGFNYVDLGALLEAIGKSAAHADHVFGRNDLHVAQTICGAAHLESPGERRRWRHVWVLWTAHPEDG